MSQEFEVPAAIEAIIAEFDSRSGVAEELALQGALTKARSELKELTEKQNLGAWLEIMSFSLMAARYAPSPWGTYFSPMMSGSRNDGTPFYSPDIAEAPSSVIEHWIARIKSIKHPVLRARYADLLWDLASKIGKIKRDPEHARAAIDSYLDSATTVYREHSYERFSAVLRALDLSLQIQDAASAAKAKNALLQLHRTAIAEMQGQWAAAFDRLITEKNAGVTDAERDQLVADLETIVARRSDKTKPDTFNPHDVQAAADRLIKHYGRVKRPNDVKRLHESVARAFEHFSSLGDAMLASAVLQTSVNSFKAAGMRDESQRVRRLMQEKTKQARSEMRTISSEYEITKDDMDAFLAGVVKDDVGQTFARIASEFLPRRAALDKQVKSTAEQAPLMAHLTSNIMSDDHVVAQVGSVEEDPFGHVVRQASQTFSLSAIWLHQALSKTMEVYKPAPEHFAGWANRAGLWTDTSLLLEGVKAWFEGDFTKCIHVIIPQIEKALRTIVGQLGRPTTKAHPTISGVSVVLNMGDILYNDEVKKALGEDITLYLSALYADPRGHNLRNQLAHGLLDADDMAESIANLLIHTLLVLGLWKELAAFRAKDKQ
jgi:lysyl-tRNA synthetase, class I